MRGQAARNSLLAKAKQPTQAELKAVLTNKAESGFVRCTVKDLKLKR